MAVRMAAVAIVVAIVVTIDVVFGIEMGKTPSNGHDQHEPATVCMFEAMTHTSPFSALLVESIRPARSRPGGAVCSAR